MPVLVYNLITPGTFNFARFGRSNIPACLSFLVFPQCLSDQELQANPSPPRWSIGLGGEPWDGEGSNQHGVEEVQIMGWGRGQTSMGLKRLHHKKEKYIWNERLQHLGIGKWLYTKWSKRVVQTKDGGLVPNRCSNQKW